MPRTLDVATRTLELAAPFRISGYVFQTWNVVAVTITEGEHRGRGEGGGVYYLGDDVPHMRSAIEAIRPAIEAGAGREDLRRAMPAGGGRNALDCALWELEAAQAGQPTWRLAGLAEPRPVRTTFTLGADAPDAMAARALAYADARAIKMKLTGDVALDLERVAAIRGARPDVWLGVDGNQGFTIADLPRLADALVAQRVALLEQPLPRGAEAQLEGLDLPLPVAGDESLLTLADVAGAVGRFDVVNIKLDKCGGLTEGLAMAAAARAVGLGVMVGCMVGTSLAMAPAFLLGQLCDVVDLDGPTFLTDDPAPAADYGGGTIFAGEDVWGGGRTRAGVTAIPAGDERRWFGQPPGLTVLFLTNMWEQFSYYGMRALLVYYLTRQLALSQGAASVVYGTYTACAYFTPIAGGVIADRWLGKRRAIVVGASIMALGHFLMIFEPLLYVALATIAIGNGLFLPSLPSQVGDLYRPDDPRRGWAFNVYYVGINIGGFLAPLVCGSLGEAFGWHYGFAAAGIGMVAGLLIYLAGQRHLPPEPARGARALAPAERFGARTLLVLLGVALSVTVFRGAYEQVGNTVAVWAGASVDRRAAGLVIPMTWFQSLNPLFVMLMTPPLLAWWRRRADRGHDQLPARRMAAGAAIVGAAYLMLAAVAALAGGGLAPWPWLVAFFVLFTFGELFILPTGLGLYARLAPTGRGATTVAAWYLTIFTGSLGAGLVGTLWSRMPHAAYFTLLAALAGVAAMLLFALDRVMGGIEKANPVESRLTILQTGQ